MQPHPSPSQEMLLMRISCVVLCLLGTAWVGNGGDESEFSSLGATGRGPRVMENVHSDCKDQDWPFCTDDDWTYKCPSGCRLKGLIDETSQDFTNRITKLRNLLFEHQRSNKDSSSVTREMLELIRGDLVSGNENDNLFGQVSEDLRRRIETLKRKVSDQAQRIINLQSSVRDQLVEMKRLEVDIDIKVRSCKGSCNRAYQYEVDLEFYKQHQKMLEQLSKINLLPSRDRQSLPILKMKPTKDFLPGNFKSQLQKAPSEWAALESMKQVEMVLENPGKERGSAPDSSSYGTGIGSASSGPSSSRPDSSRYPDVEPWDSKPGNPSWGNTRWEGSSRETAGSMKFGTGSSHSSKFFTSGPGKEFPVGSKDTSGLFTTKRSSCSKTVTKTIVNGPEGPKEVTKEVLTSDDGSDCSDLAGVGFDLGTGGIFNSRGTPDGTSEGRGDFNSRLTDALSFFESSATGTRYQGLNPGRGDSKFGTQHSHSQKSESDTFMEHGDGRSEDFSHIDTPDFTPSKTQGVTSTKTVVSSSSSFSRDGSTFETKSYKEAEVEGGRKTTAESLNVRSSKSLHRPRDCDDVLQTHPAGAQSGIFSIKPAGSSKVFSVYCDQETGLGGWLLIQQRLDGSVNFNRTWQDYKEGFGSLDAKGEGEFWLGNEHLHLLTQRDTVLRVELEDWSGNEAYAEYNVHVGSEAEGYVLRVSAFEGTAGDALLLGSLEEGTEYTSHANMQFSTFDRDADQWEENCAEVYGGGWWYNNCQGANLNGIYYPGGQYDPRNNSPYEIENGVVWIPFRGSDYSLRTVRMKIRPLETQLAEVGNGGIF